MASSKLLLVSLLILSLVLFAQPTEMEDYLGGDCDFTGSCKTRRDCAKPCSDRGYSPTAVLCVPSPTYRGGRVCCCITAD